MKYAIALVLVLGLAGVASACDPSVGLAACQAQVGVSSGYGQVQVGIPAAAAVYGQSFASANVVGIPFVATPNAYAATVVRQNFVGIPAANVYGGVGAQLVVRHNVVVNAGASRNRVGILGRLRNRLGNRSTTVTRTTTVQRGVSH